ncbi:2-hydroxyacid dehydrogenase [Treponema sp. TIM-1]|uniref:2-hydroxyacid dehydrogenase n=1 Tax=Treponema sp. TIM-1 TaxID=2898417 RepID=UPI00398161B7
METVKIAFFDTKPYDRDYFDPLLKDPAFPLKLKYLNVRLGPDTAALASGYDGICIFVNDRIDAVTADILYRQGIKIIALRSAGYNNVDLEALRGKIPVVRVPAYSPHAVAEYAVSLLLTLNRKTHKAYSRVREGNFSLAGLEGFDLYQKIAGIIGTGQIGKITAEILRGFGMEVLASDPYPSAEWAKAHGVLYIDREELIRRSDIISLHCPLTPENRRFINRGALSSMKPGAIIINTGRGGLIDTRDLIYALKENHLGGAALDVYEEEDRYFFEDHSGQVIQDDVLARLMTFPNVLITSHQAFFTREALSAIAETTLENLRRFFEKNERPHEIKTA